MRRRHQSTLLAIPGRGSAPILAALPRHHRPPRCPDVHRIPRPEEPSDDGAAVRPRSELRRPRRPRPETPPGRGLARTGHVRQQVALLFGRAACCFALLFGAFNLMRCAMSRSRHAHSYNTHARQPHRSLARRWRLGATGFEWPLQRTEGAAPRGAVRPLLCLTQLRREFTLEKSHTNHNF